MILISFIESEFVMRWGCEVHANMPFHTILTCRVHQGAHAYSSG